MQNNWVRPAKLYPPIIISMGWSSPDTRYLAKNIAQLETREWPFTGTTVCVFDQSNADYRKYEGGSMDGSGHPADLGWRVFDYRKRFDNGLFDTPKRELELAQKRATSLRNNFLSVTANWREAPQCPDEWSVFDWFDSEWWDCVLSNISLLASLAYEGGLRGLMIDAEGASQAGIWTWRDWPQTEPPNRNHTMLFDKTPYKDKTPEEVVAKVYERGYEFIDTINSSFPQGIVWLTYGYSHVGPYPPGSLRLPNRFAQSGNGLWAAFIDGMITGCNAKTIIVDGCEGAYVNNIGPVDVPEANRFTYKGLYQKAFETGGHAWAMTSVPALYPEVMRIGLAVGLVEEHSNPIQQELFIKDVYDLSHGYLWFYHQRYSWWLPPSGRFPANVLAVTGQEPWWHFARSENNILATSFRESMKEIMRTAPQRL